MRDVITRAFCVYRDFFVRWYAIHKCSSAVAPNFNRNTQNSTHRHICAKIMNKKKTINNHDGVWYLVYKMLFFDCDGFFGCLCLNWIDACVKSEWMRKRKRAGANGHVQCVKLRWREMNQHHSVCIRCYPLCMYKSHWQTGCAFKVSQRVLKCRNAYQ